MIARRNEIKINDRMKSGHLKTEIDSSTKVPLHNT